MGVIATTQGVVFGGGIYDGRFNVDLVNDTNYIQRPFSLKLFLPDPNPREVLMIGLSSGSWAQVIANHPQVEHLTVVEINPGYLGLIAKHPEERACCRTPRSALKSMMDDKMAGSQCQPQVRCDCDEHDLSLAGAYQQSAVH